MEQMICPDWPAPNAVRAASTLRGITPEEAWGSLAVPGEVRWLKQVHGARVVRADEAWASVRADACVAFSPNAACVLRTADCLPILLCDDSGTRVGAAHAGWRGLASGVIEATVAALCEGGPQAVDPAGLMAWIGPGIGGSVYQVGPDVFQAITAAVPDSEGFFAIQDPDHWLLNLAALARQQLGSLGVSRVYGGRWCTYSDPGRFHSYRRDQGAGRHASFIWLDS